MYMYIHVIESHVYDSYMYRPTGGGKRLLGGEEELGMGRRGGEGWGSGTLNTPLSNHFISQFLPRGQTQVQSKGHMFLL